jgi:hypothetical protein
MGEIEPFEREVERVRASGVLGRTGRLRELFDFLATRGPAQPVSQADIAHEVFGQLDAGADDATARVYVHRLRKRLADFYAREGSETGRLVLPAGSYELVFEEAAPVSARAARARAELYWVAPLLVLAALATAFVLGREAGSPGRAAEANAIWQPFLESDRQIVVAVGDYYIFGEIDPFEPERGRMIRDFAIDSPTDLARAQESDPDRYGRAEDMGLSYLPLSSAYALRSLMPVLARHPQPVEIVATSVVSPQMLRDRNVVYIGLVSGMGLLEEVTFSGSDLSVGETYDDLRDAVSGRRYSSGEALSRTSTEYYRDFGYIARFRRPGGALVAVVAGARDTGLRGLAPLAVGELDARLEDVASGDGSFEAVFEFTGQQGADLASKLDLARERR